MKFQTPFRSSGSDNQSNAPKPSSPKKSLAALTAHIAPRKRVSIFAQNRTDAKGAAGPHFKSPMKLEGRPSAQPGRPSTDSTEGGAAETPSGMKTAENAQSVRYPPSKLQKTIAVQKQPEAEENSAQKIETRLADTAIPEVMPDIADPPEKPPSDLIQMNPTTGQPLQPEAVVKRLPVSPLGKWYFEIEFVENDSKRAAESETPQPEPEKPKEPPKYPKRQCTVAVPKRAPAPEPAAEKPQRRAPTGILIISKPGLDDFIAADPSHLAMHIFDNQGRQIGNRGGADASLPAWTIPAAEADKLSVGDTHKTKSAARYVIKLIAAVREDEFRGGSFFLDFQKKQNAHTAAKRKANIFAMQFAVSASQPSGKLKSIIATQNSAHIFSRGFGLPRRTSFCTPFKGLVRDSSGINLTGPIQPKFDPDAPNAVVVYRAPYEKDTAGKSLCSVVVDPVLGDRLRPHQVVGVRFLYECISGERLANVHHGAILADEMGLGKSIQAVTLVWTCLKQSAHGGPLTTRAIITAPCSLVDNWRKEFDKWLGEGALRICAIAESTPKGNRILSRFESDGDVLIISYDQLRKYVDRIASMKRVGLIVCDEGHKLKNAEVKTTMAIQRVPTKRRVILSGTPIQNDLSEFHSMVSFVNPGILGSLDVFKRVFQDPILRGRDPNCSEEEKMLGMDRAHYLSKLTAKFILRRKQTLNEKYLPAKCEMTLFCPLSGKQRQLYSEIVAAYDSDGDETFGALLQQPFTAIMALRQLSCHADLLLDASEGAAVNSSNEKEKPTKSAKSDRIRAAVRGMDEAEKSAKLCFLMDLVAQCRAYEDKIVIVSNFTATLNIIAKALKRHKFNYLQLDGTTPIKKRQGFVDEFNLSNVRSNRYAPLVFLLSSKAGGVGLNLVGANRLVLFDPDWNPANDAQAMGRVWRDGQKKTVFIYRLLSTGTIEEKIFMRQVSKQGLSTNIVDSNQDSKQHFTLEDLRMLFTYNPKTTSETHDLLKCDQCVDPNRPLSVKKQKEGFAAKFSKPKFKGPVRMEELKDWTHVNTLGVLKGFDALLHKVVGSVKESEPNRPFAPDSTLSFIFCVSRDPQKLGGENEKSVIVEEKSDLEKDAGAITIAEQQDSLEDASIAFSQD